MSCECGLIIKECIAMHTNLFMFEVLYSGNILQEEIFVNHMILLSVRNIRNF